jgi:hypothetical protein
MQHLCKLQEMIYKYMQRGKTVHVISIISRWHLFQGPRLSLPFIYTKISVYTTRHMAYKICIELFAFCCTARHCTLSSFFLCNYFSYLNITIHPIIITNNNLLYNMSILTLSLDSYFTPFILFFKDESLVKACQDYSPLFLMQYQHATS